MGGLVRDALLGRAISDIDLAIESDTRSIGRELASSLGGKFVLLDDERDIVRIALRRRDGMCFVDISPVHNGILEDLGRRDFTIDAMAVSLENITNEFAQESVIDPYGGLSDLREGTIRAVNISVFVDDPARLVRASRLAAQLRFNIAEETARQIRHDAHLVSTIAPERVREELLKLLAEPGAMDSIRGMDELGLLCEIIPELAQAKNVTQPKEHYWDVFNHLVETVGQVERILQQQPPDDDYVVEMMPRFDNMSKHFAEEFSDGHTRLTFLKLAGLLHDIAKPATRTVESTGRIRFLGHHSEGAEMTKGILQRLRFSKRAVESLSMMVQHHLRPGQMAQDGELPSGKAIFRYFRDTGDSAIDTLYLNMADYLAARGPLLSKREWSDYSQTVGHILREGLERKAPKSLPHLIDGHDIMEAFSLAPGPRVGELLGLAQEASAGGEISSKEDALEFVRNSLNAGGGSA
ncbi:MAG: HD domain-containing protein [Chloroflexi bacterium]|nr:HD domain-containing protein [Chloroflexota bacterium]